MVSVTPRPYVEGMEAITLLSQQEQPELDAALANLAEVFAFTVVERCAEPVCEICEPAEISAAA